MVDKITFFASKCFFIVYGEANMWNLVVILFEGKNKFEKCENCCAKIDEAQVF